MPFSQRPTSHLPNRSENTGEFLLRDLAKLTNSIYCYSQHGGLMNRFPVMITPISWREFPTIFWSEKVTHLQFDLGMTLALVWPWRQISQTKLNWCSGTKLAFSMTWPWPWAMTLILKLDLDIVRMYHHIKMKFLCQLLQSSNRHKHTDNAKTLLPREVIYESHPAGKSALTNWIQV